jgi:hypothetical protein
MFSLLPLRAAPTMFPPEHLALCACAIFRREDADITLVGWFACWGAREPFNDSVAEIA